MVAISTCAALILYIHLMRVFSTCVPFDMLDGCLPAILAVVLGTELRGVIQHVVVALGRGLHVVVSIRLLLVAAMRFAIHGDCRDHNGLHVHWRMVARTVLVVFPATTSAVGVGGAHAAEAAHVSAEAGSEFVAHYRLKKSDLCLVGWLRRFEGMKQALEWCR